MRTFKLNSFLAIPRRAYSWSLVTLVSLSLVMIPLVPAAEQELTAEQWREDLRFMAAELPERHLDVFHTMTQEDFESAVNLLDERIPELQGHEIIVELSRIAAMMHDGHSGIRLYDDEKIEFSSCPIRFYQYKDGLFVQRAARSHAHVVGARVVRIGDVATVDALKLAGDVISRDNDMFIDLFAPFLLTSPEILHALGIVGDPSEVSYVFEIEGKEVTVKLAPQGMLRLTGHAHYDSGMDSVDWVDARDASANETPLWLQRDVRESYWFEYLENERTVYFRYNEIMNGEKESAEAFAERMFEFIDTHDVELLVVDLRWNDGGNNALTRPILRAIIQSRKVDQRGKLFAVIGRRTFSAAQTFVNQLELYTNALFIGEPTAQNVNHFGDTFRIKLPNSGITVKASFVKFQPRDHRDTRQWTEPHLRTALTSEQYRNNVDPAMEAILAHSELLGQFYALSPTEDFTRWVKAYRAVKDTPALAAMDTEGLLNGVGYRFLGGGRLSHAIEVFQLNVAAYPNSANAYDSLGEAYLENGEVDLALTTYERAVKLDPDGSVGANSTRMIQRIHSEQR
jgi:tetratricopeptide (TPR) repeat protein